ncbi:hypothetical protein M9H77_22757 [Catharanthus roseus]|uniref:Uncharacterized protein n=1 Tax=Catharanthus roseus TaxID=4058 RepID=A0ACC0ATI6_CATRO|nr:hypothetical protein M9H77_22757 [Catharanthus roseus]
MEEPYKFFLGGQGQQRPENPLGFLNRGPPLSLPYEAGPQNQPPLAKANHEELLVKFMGESGSFIKNLEKQIGHLVKLVSKRTLRVLPSNTEVNPREHVNAVSVIVEEEISAKVEEERSSSGNDEEDEGVVEEDGKKKATSASSKQKVPKYVRHLKDMIMKKDKLHEDDEKRTRLSSNVKTRLMKWVLVRHVKQAKAKKEPNDLVRGGALSTYAREYSLLCFVVVSVR